MTVPSTRPRRQRFHLVEGMVLIAGIAVSFWLFTPALRENFLGEGQPRGINLLASPLAFLPIVIVLGGLSWVGVPLLLIERARRRRDPAWGEGRILWFATGSASWLLWPPIIARRATGSNINGVSEVCYIYGTPLMALYVIWALWAGGRLRRNRRRRLVRRSWRERFGLILGALWACTGLYLLAWIYAGDWRR
ncbi:MAG: hypothetical protein KatS3mg108_2302 [Isosphaeraceae bacterium]|jgi:predicted permease|nr:MAG: hypothetical protein KatS3mg108_2302 [Isosphaeraceae bacterium]